MSGIGVLPYLGARQLLISESLACETRGSLKAGNADLGYCGTRRHETFPPLASLAECAVGTSPDSHRDDETEALNGC